MTALNKTKNKDNSIWTNNMFGALRFYLALLVVMTHVLNLSHIGQFAVFGFYTLSGYLMTLVMSKTYRFTWVGFRLFWKNRALRLLPAYWVSLLLSLAVIWLIGISDISSYNARMELPETYLDWLKNMTIMFVSLNPIDVTPRLTTVSWAVTVELFFYLMISLGLSKHIRLVILWFSISIVYHLVSFYFDESYTLRYMPIIAASLPFSLGALIYHLMQREKPLFDFLRGSHGLIIMLMSLSFIPFLMLDQARKQGQLSWETFETVLNAQFYIAYTLIALTIYVIALAKEYSSVIPKKLDTYLGDIAYPVYLFHLQFGYLFAYLLYGQPMKVFSIEGGYIFFLTISATIVTSTATVYLIEKPIERIRTRNRSKATQAQYDLRKQVF